jgi:Co/Zn/Cd efflux system component
VLVNIGVAIAGALVALSGIRAIDLISGVILAGFVIHEGWELWEAGEGPLAS